MHRVLESFRITRLGEAWDTAVGRLRARAVGASVLPERLPAARSYLLSGAPCKRSGDVRFGAIDSASELLGFCDLRLRDGYVQYLFTAPEQRGSGVGTALLARAQRECGGPIWLLAHAVNDRSVLWYLRRGFRITGGHSERWHGADVVWLRLARERAQPA
ncbi:MAG: GNAT family N-acetyltransferase [Geminicoccaceae bacterium]